MFDTCQFLPVLFNLPRSALEHDEYLSINLPETIVLSPFEFDHIGMVTEDGNLGSAHSSRDAGRVFWYYLKRGCQFVSEKNPRH